MLKFIKQVFGLLMAILGLALLLILTSPIWIYLIIALGWTLVVVLGISIVVLILAVPFLLFFWGLKLLGK